MEARHGSSLGARNASDAEIMACAATDDHVELTHVVLTHDLDFSAILAVTRGRKPSVVQTRTCDVSPSAIGQQGIKALLQMDADREDSALLTVDTG